MRVHSPPVEPLAALVEALKQAWRAGAAPDAPGVLREHPDLLRHRSLVVDLAYEEYCLREEAGDVPEVEAFCRRFPAFQSHVREVIRGHRLLADHPELLERPPVWPRPGDPFEQLTIERELGRGAFARVYLARDPEAGDRPVVLKLAPTRSGEARTLGAISHNHIVSVLWARQSGGFFAVCMPFVGSVTLRDAIESVFRPEPPGSSVRTRLATLAAPGLPVPPRRLASVFAEGKSHADTVATIATQVADAVSYLHRSGIVHGDLKPSNVLLGSGGHPYLIDFNLSTALEESPLRCGGTLPYMAPERLRLMLGGKAEPGAGTAGDVYAFAVVLFEALTGRVPFEPSAATDPTAVAADLLHRLTARRFAQAAGRNDIPRPLASLIDRCLDPNPARRPTIDRVKRELDRYLSRRVRRRVLVGAVALVGLIAAGAAVWFAVPPAPPIVERQPEPSPVAANPTTPDEFFARGLSHLKSGATAPAMKDFDDANRLRPDGPNTAYLAYCHARSGQHLAAAKLYQEAEVKHGFSPAWVRNNRAHSLMQAGPTADQLREAMTEAQAALALDPQLRPARLNKVRAKFQLCLAEGTTDAPDPEAVADIEAVMREPPYTAGLYYKAAVMTVTFGGGRPECKSRAVEYLEEAVKLGHPLKSIESDLILRRHLGDRPDFRRVLELPAGTPSASPFNPHVVTPPLG